MIESHELRQHVTVTYHAPAGYWTPTYSTCARGPIHAVRRIRRAFPETRTMRLATIRSEPGAVRYFGTDA